MSKNAILFIIGTLVLLILGVLVFALTNKVNDSGNSTQAKTNPVDPNGINNDDLAVLARTFRDAFDSISNWGHCDVLETVDGLNTAQLKQFADTYYQLFNISVIQQMDAAYSWCWENGSGRRVYDKLKAL